MPKLKQEKSKRGGTQKPKKLVSGQARLLQAIWKKKDGIFEISRRIGIHHQTPLNWKLRGKVPLDECGPVSRALDIPLEAFNYEGIYKLLGVCTPWENLVKSLKFDPKIESWILKGKEPKCDMY